MAEIERENLFVVALDSTRRWYRYHHLFGELLRHDLETAEPGIVTDLHARAAAWFAEQGMAADAIHHVQLTGRRHVGFAVDPGHRAPTVAIR